MTTLFHLWLYGSGAVLLISVFGLMSIMTIPLIKTRHHTDVLQLLVGLAIGTLTSDALLHLLPHAFSGETHQQKVNVTPGHSHSHEDHGHEHDDHSSGDDHAHERTVLYGLMALTGIIGFLTFERVLTILSDLCSKSNRKTTKVASSNRAAGDKPANHSHNHHNHGDSHSHEAGDTAPMLEKLNSDALALKACDDKTKAVGAGNGLPEAMDVACMTGSNANSAHAPLTTEQCHRETVVYQHPDPDRGFVVQLTDHHHHHQHQSAQKGAKSVIYMIVTGDGLHNLMDGLAIGIAFAGGGIGGGLSTSVAVLCHELPHEVGDFAVLLKAGLSVKKAVMYNTLSAFLCFIGMTIGIIVGKMDTGMLTSLIAGMFLYIALVDMIPQLDCCPTSSGTTRAFKLTVQLCGIGIGVAIMAVISLYEPDLQKLFSNVS